MYDKLQQFDYLRYLASNSLILIQRVLKGYQSCSISWSSFCEKGS